MKLTEAYKLPAIYGFSVRAHEGALMSYAPDIADMYAKAVSYVDRVLKGESPASLPVQVPTKFELMINLKTAKSIGVTVPPSPIWRHVRGSAYLAHPRGQVCRSVSSSSARLAATKRCSMWRARTSGCGLGPASRPSDSMRPNGRAWCDHPRQRNSVPICLTFAPCSRPSRRGLETLAQAAASLRRPALISLARGAPVHPRAGAKERPPAQTKEQHE